MRVTDKDLAALDIDPSTARRQFKRYVGMTFHAYSRARRMGLALHDVRNGRRLIDIQLDRGFESGSAFREAFTKLFGVPPSKAKKSECLLGSCMKQLAQQWRSEKFSKFGVKSKRRPAGYAGSTLFVRVLQLPVHDVFPRP